MDNENVEVIASQVTRTPYLYSEATCPFCGEVSGLRHLESFNSPVKVEVVCRHTKSYLFDLDKLLIEFGAQHPPRKGETNG